MERTRGDLLLRRILFFTFFLLSVQVAKEQLDIDPTADDDPHGHAGEEEQGAYKKYLPNQDPGAGSFYHVDYLSLRFCREVPPALSGQINEPRTMVTEVSAMVRSPISALLNRRINS
jgi:hypothetical protein